MEKLLYPDEVNVNLEHWKQLKPLNGDFRNHVTQILIQLLLSSLLESNKPYGRQLQMINHTRCAMTDEQMTMFWEWGHTHQKGCHITKETAIRVVPALSIASWPPLSHSVLPPHKIFVSLLFNYSLTKHWKVWFDVCNAVALCCGSGKAIQKRRTTVVDFLQLNWKQNAFRNALILQLFNHSSIIRLTSKRNF